MSVLHQWSLQQHQVTQSHSLHSHHRLVVDSQWVAIHPRLGRERKLNVFLGNMGRT